MKKAYQHPLPPPPSPYISLNREQVARIMVDAVRPYCIMCYDPPPKVWADMSQREQAVYLGIVGALIDDRDLTAERYHATVAERMRADGWKHSVVADYTLKTHPLVGPWSDLRPQYRSRQCFLFAIARQLLYPG